MQLGLESSGVLTQDGHVYMWGNSGESEGSSGAGRLGLGHSEVFMLQHMFCIEKQELSV